MSTGTVMRLTMSRDLDIYPATRKEITLELLQEGIGGGFVEAVAVAPGITFWVDEDGIAKGMRPNIPAMMLAAELGGMPRRFYGDVFITGGVDAHGNTLPLTEARKKRVLRVV